MRHVTHAQSDLDMWAFIYSNYVQISVRHGMLVIRPLVIGTSLLCQLNHGSGSDSRGDDMILKVKVGLFACAVAGSAAVTLMQPFDQAAMDTGSSVGVTIMTSDLPHEEFKKGIGQAHSAAERPFAVLASNVR